MVGASVSHRTPIAVPTTNAIRVEGRYLSYLLGQSIAMATVAMAMANALASKSLNIPEKLPSVAIGPPAAIGAPRKGGVWTRMMITPTPVMNPDMTEYGV